VPNVQFVELKPALCGADNMCAYRIGDRLLYDDTQHLSANGAAYALRDFHLPALVAGREQTQAGSEE
jgi:hypothetical protein